METVPIQLKSTLEGLKKLSSGGIKSPKMLVIIGLFGILLIFLSQCDVKKESANIGKEADEISAQEYRLSLENGVRDLVSDITGDQNPTVIVTLESGIRYSYADTAEINSSSGTDTKSENSTRSYVTVRTSDGGEQALLVTELMPKVRGVAIICNGGDDEKTAEKIEGAVTAAFDITSKRVYIAGGKDYEKG